MKNKLLIYLQSLAVLWILTMLFSLVFATLYYFNIISTNTFHILNWIFGILAYGGAGLWFGKNIEKKALLNASFLVIPLAILTLLLCEHQWLAILEVLSKLLSYMLLCMFAFTKRHQASSF